MSIFVKDTDTFTINFVVANDKKNSAVVYVADDLAGLALLYPDYEKIATKPESHSITFRFPSYKDNAETLDDSINISEGRFKFQTSLLRLHRMNRLTASWTFVDDEKKPVEIDENSIGALNPILGSFIGEKMEEVLGIL